jgi:hypothetical protein
MMTQMAQMQQQQQQMQAQMAQSQQQMMMQMQSENMKLMITMQQAQAQAAQASNDKLMQLMLAGNGKEDATTAVLKEQLRQAQQQINGLSQRGDEVEELAEKIAKMKQLSEILGGGMGGGGGSRDIVSALLENADTVGAGVAKMLQAYGASKAIATQSAAPAGPPAGGYPPVMGLPGGAPAYSPPQLAGVPQVDPRMAQAQAMMEEATSTPPPEQKPMNPPERAVAALDTIAKTDDEETIVNAFIEYLKSMNESEFPLFQKQLERILQAFQEADEREDIYTLCKHLWIALNLKPEKAAAKKLAVVVTKWYPLIHKSFFGEARLLPEETVMPDVQQALAAADGQASMGEDEGDDEDEDEDDEDEDEEGDE